MKCNLKELIPDDWRSVLAEEFEKEYFSELESFLEKELNSYQVFPPVDEIFTALRLTSFDDVRVVVIGQDPYHDDNQAHGLAFSVKAGVKLPPSLKNIYKELENDLGFPPASTGNLTAWAEQGVLMLNTVLTVRAHDANSHAGHGWEVFTDAIFVKISSMKENVVFVLWGGNAAKKISIIDTSKHHIIRSAHPSPLSAYRGFFDSKPFSKINDFLEKNGSAPIDWRPQGNDTFDDMPLFSAGNIQ